MHHRMTLSNETKIRFCNAWNALEIHQQRCQRCMEYLRNGDDDLCDVGKDIIALEMAFADTSPEPSMNAPSFDAMIAKLK